MNSFRLQNIKSFKDSGDIELKPITILVGQNSCGKSSLLRFPAVLAQTAGARGINPPISLFGEYLDYGNFEDVVFGKVGKEIAFTVDYRIHKTIRNSKRQESKTDCKNVKLFVKLRRVNNSIKVNEEILTCNNSLISKLYWDDDNNRFALILADEDGDENYSEHIYFDKDNLAFSKIFPKYREGSVIKSIYQSNNFEYIHDPDVEEMIIKTHNKKEQENDGGKIAEAGIIYNRFLNTLNWYEEIENRFYEDKYNISYIGPFRNKPERIYRNSESIKSSVGSKGENIAEILVRAYQRREKSDLYKNISQWLYKYFGYELDIKDLGNNFFQLMVKDKQGDKLNIMDVGFGISQILPIISEICMFSDTQSRQNRKGEQILLIEQPELHLHPAAQASLAELFAMCVTTNKNSRLVIETHSEHLITKLQVLIADENFPLTNDMVQILYVDKDESGAAYIEKMKIKENGKFVKEWPTGFFDQGYNLAYELMKKAAARGKS